MNSASIILHHTLNCHGVTVVVVVGVGVCVCMRMMVRPADHIIRYFVWAEESSIRKLEQQYWFITVMFLERKTDEEEEEEAWRRPLSLQPSQQSGLWKCFIPELKKWWAALNWTVFISEELKLTFDSHLTFSAQAGKKSLESSQEEECESDEKSDKREKCSEGRRSYLWWLTTKGVGEFCFDVLNHRKQHKSLFETSIETQSFSLVSVINEMCRGTQRFQ